MKVANKFQEGPLAIILASSPLLLLRLVSLVRALLLILLDLDLASAELPEHVNDILTLDAGLELLLWWIEVHEPLKADR